MSENQRERVLESLELWFGLLRKSKFGSFELDIAKFGIMDRQKWQGYFLVTPHFGTRLTIRTSSKRAKGSMITSQVRLLEWKKHQGLAIDNRSWFKPSALLLFSKCRSYRVFLISNFQFFLSLKSKNTIFKLLNFKRLKRTEIVKTILE